MIKNKFMLTMYSILTFALVFFLGMKVFVPVYQDYIKIEESINRIDIDNDYYAKLEGVKQSDDYVRIDVFRKVNILTSAGIEISMFKSDKQINSLSTSKTITYVPEIDKSLLIIILIVAIFLVLCLKQNTIMRIYLAVFSESILISSLLVVIFCLNSDVLVLLIK